jgi:superfamily I DNA/RNA helicase
MSEAINLRLSYDVGCLRSLKKLPSKVTVGFLDMMTKVMSDPSRNGLNVEAVEGAKDRGIKSVRIDQGHRAIGYLSGSDLLFLHVNEHDKAYRWATNRAVKIDPKSNRIRIVEAVEEVASATPLSAAPVVKALFSPYGDTVLGDLGVMPEEIGIVRAITDENDLEAKRDHLDITTYDVLIALASGMDPEEIKTILGLAPVAEQPEITVQTDFARAIETDESRQTIFIPETETELRRFLEGDMEGWRVFLHPNQRKVAYRDYNGPAMVRGGAGTGKTVVAMHRAKFLADRIAQDKARAGERVLVTTFTTSLAHDIEANLRTLCPEHFQSSPPLIEVSNLDAWVGEFLKRQNFERRIAYFGEDAESLNDIWDRVFSTHGVPGELTRDFVRAEWSQVIQAKGVETQKDYFKVARTGRGTPLDRQKRAELWVLFEDYRARLLDEGLAEPDDAYREAITLLNSGAVRLPYSAVIVDEAQDMGEQAFRLIRAIVKPTGGGDQNSVFIVGDAHQRIYARKASMSACGMEVKGRSRKLKLNYRTTDDIRRWAVAVLDGVAVDDLDEGSDSLDGYISLMRGPLPVSVPYGSVQLELEGLVDWINHQVADGRHHEEIGILARTNYQLDQVGSALEAQNIPFVRLTNKQADSQKKPGVRLLTMHRAKGLEFRVVAIPFLSKGAFPPDAALKGAVDPADARMIGEREKSLLHVAATRAKEELRLSWSGTKSDVLP